MPLPSPGLSYAAERFVRTLFPKVTITAPAHGIRFERNVEVPMRDGAKLRVNVFRPEGGRRFPVIACAHPYGKDVFPKRSPFGYMPLKRYRFIRQPDPITFSAYTTWEGFSDVYRDVAYPGGVREDGFLPFWSSMTERDGRTSDSLRAGQLAHADCDDFWAARTPALERIEVPALICASFSDQGMHTRGSFEAFRRIGSANRFLYTHRGAKWSVYYSPEALALQSRFFDCFLKGEDNGMRDGTPVRLEIRTRRTEVHAVRDERAWPPPSLRWSSLHLGPGELRAKPFHAKATARFDVPEGGASFALHVPRDMVLAGPMKLRLHVELVDADDAHLFIAVSKVEGRPTGTATDGRVLPFEGSFGFGCDVVAKGWLRMAHRRVDESRSEPWRPFLPCDRAEPMRPGQVAPVDIELLPSATYFAHGNVLRLDVRGRWFWRRNMFFGMFPATYAPSLKGQVILHFGDVCDSHLLVPQMD
jgi:putative CocE/NonD family hydrolase